MLTVMSVSGLVYVATEPELSYTPNKTAVVNFAVASNRRWKDQGNSEHEESCFIDCVCFKNLAEAVDRNVGKGDPLYIEGRLKQEKWESKDGEKRSKHVLTLSRVVFLKPKE